MELEFGKHFKDATNLLLMMDHDSGYVEGSENYPNLDCYKDGDGTKPGNFYLSEDALLERPDVLQHSTNLGQGASDNYEELRPMFFSPDIVIDSSVKSAGSTALYSGLESECNSEPSLDIPLQNAIVVDQDNISQGESDISVSDMSLETSVCDSLIIENSKTSSNTDNDNIITPLKGFPVFENEMTNKGNDSQKNIVNNYNDADKNSVFLEPRYPHNSGSLDKSVPSSGSIPKGKKKLTLVFSKANKENEYQVKRKYPSLTPEKNLEEPLSPELFGEDEIYDQPVYFDTQTMNVPKLPVSQFSSDDLYVSKLDHRFLKRTQKGLSGVLPPPSVTVVNLSFSEMLGRINENKEYFWNSESNTDQSIRQNKDSSLNSSGDSINCSKSVLINAESFNSFDSNEWPEILNTRYHGLHHNRNKISEEIESLCEKYQKRFVGAETQSTCTVFETQISSPSKRRMTKPRWGGKSPGRRLSHLARRRITFSSANLQVGGSTLAGSRARQILVDARKMELLNRRKSPRKTPKKTPRKSPTMKTRTPSSSAKKKLAMRFRKLTGEFEVSQPGTSSLMSYSPSKSTKRALFQSPNRDKNSSLVAVCGGKSQNILTSAEKSKLRRALFSSPRKNSPLKGKRSPFKQALRFGYEKKRKRSESDDMPALKFSRSMSMDVRMSSSSNKPVLRTQSEMNVSLNKSQSPYELTDAHKKKLQWAVYGALQTHNITRDHSQWKIFAAVLGRVTRYFFTNQVAASVAAGAKPEGGTTERMNRIAKVHILSVIKGKSADEIITEYLKSRPRVQKPQGYIAPENYNSLQKKVTSGSKDHVLQDRGNTIDSWERSRIDQMTKPTTTENRIERIRKVINFGDDR